VAHPGEDVVGIGTGADAGPGERGADGVGALGDQRPVERVAIDGSAGPSEAARGSPPDAWDRIGQQGPQFSDLSGASERERRADAERRRPVPESAILAGGVEPVGVAEESVAESHAPTQYRGSTSARILAARILVRRAHAEFHPQSIHRQEKAATVGPGRTAPDPADDPQ
jgi:hypothetical protein